jgi:hypothetical protein
MSPHREPTAQTTLEVDRLSLTKQRLAQLPIDERRLLLLLGHAANELNVFKKLLIMSGQTRGTVQMEDHVLQGQTLILMRVLIGKLHEAWELFKKRFQENGALSLKYQELLGPEAKAALEYLKQSFGGGSVLTQIRNRLSFHYEDKDDLIEESFKCLPTNEAWDFYFSTTVGNSFYYASELVVSRSVSALAKRDMKGDENFELRDQNQFQQICDETIRVAGEITILFRDCIKAIIQSNFDNIERKLIAKIEVPQLSTLRIPFFSKVP